MDEAGVEIGRLPQVPEGVSPVRMVNVGEDAEHLTAACLYVGNEALRKPSALANPVAAGECRKGHIEGCRTGGNRSVGVGGIQASGGIGRRTSSDIFGREGLWVAQLAYNPTLNQRNVLASWHFDGDLVIIEPSVRMAPKTR